MSIKERYQRFKQWQRDPFQYKNNQPDTVRCANCGTEFASNYCPICGQKADIGRVGWKSLRQSVALLWGLDSRSLGFTLVQLFLRPGYLIGDYISGRQRVSFPPVKMLFIVAIAYALFNNFLGHPDAVTGEAGFAQTFYDWNEENPGWGMLCICSFMIFPTLLLFRYAPRHDHHKLPEGFFIQVFMSTIAILIQFLSLYSDWFILVVGFYYVVAYQQLFGYGLWGTLWRTICSIVIAIIFFLTFLYLIDSLITWKYNIPKPIVVYVIISISILIIAHFINKKSAKKTHSKNA